MTHVENLPCSYSVRDHGRVHGACIRTGPARSGGWIDLRRCCTRRIDRRLAAEFAVCVSLECDGRSYTYRGTIGRLGLDVGITGGGRLFWAVFAPTSHVGYGVLRGTYVGASGNASFGLGLGANVLVGGSNRTISLQPLSVEGQFGINLALGVARLTLR